MEPRIPFVFVKEREREREVKGKRGGVTTDKYNGELPFFASTSLDFCYLQYLKVKPVGGLLLVMDLAGPYLFSKRERLFTYTQRQKGPLLSVSSLS